MSIQVISQRNEIIRIASSNLKLLSTRSLKLTKNTGDTEQNNHTINASKFQVNFLQLLLNWTKRVASQGELYIEMFIKEATS